MDGTRALPLLDRAHRIPALPRRPLSHLPTAWAVVLGAGWPVVIAVGMAIEPAPADPDAAGVGLLASTIGLLVTVAYLSLIARTAVLAARRDLATPRWALGVGLATVAAVVSCPASGHHTIGLWWYGQVVAVTAMLAVSAAGWRRNRQPAA